MGCVDSLGYRGHLVGERSEAKSFAETLVTSEGNGASTVTWGLFKSKQQRQIPLT